MLAICGCSVATLSVGTDILMGCGLAPLCYGLLVNIGSCKPILGTKGALAAKTPTYNKLIMEIL